MTQVQYCLLVGLFATLTLRMIIPWAVYYIARAAAIGWLRGHVYFYETLEGDSNGERKSAP